MVSGTRPDENSTPRYREFARTTNVYNELQQLERTIHDRRDLLDDIQANRPADTDGE